MSNKTTEVNKKAGAKTPIIVRGNGKPEPMLRQIGQRAGKSLSLAAWEMWPEHPDSPPATPEEAEAFCRVHIKRCNINLANAKGRGDKRAVLNLERKLAVYEYLYKLSASQVAAFKSTTACPRCRVYAVGKDRVCSCCGAIYPQDG